MSVIFKRTKILATLGPPTNNYESIKALAVAGVNGFRLNFSHGSYEERDQQLEWIRKASEELKKPVAILQDLQGPKIRLGNLIENTPDICRAPAGISFLKVSVAICSSASIVTRAVCSPFAAGVSSFADEIVISFAFNEIAFVGLRT